MLLFVSSFGLGLTALVILLLRWWGKEEPRGILGDLMTGVLITISLMPVMIFFVLTL